VIRLNEMLAERWPVWFPGEDADGISIGFVARTSMDPPRGVVFAIPGRSRIPRAIIKVSLSTGGAPMLEREVSNLKTVRASGGEHVRRSTPEPIAFERLDNSVTIAVFGYVRGTLLIPVSAFGRRSRLAEHAIASHLKAARALGVLLSRLPTASRPWRATDQVELLLDSENDISTGSLDRLRTSAERVDRAQRIMTVWQHGDLAQGNLLFHWGRPSAVDWELAGDHYPPWFDLSYALITNLLIGDRPIDGQLAVEVFGLHRWSGRAMRSFIRRHWDHSVSIGDAALLAAVQSGLRSRELGRGGHERWDQVVTALTSDRVRDAVSWIAPIEEDP
jgi:hypothetical protein